MLLSSEAYGQTFRTPEGVNGRDRQLFVAAGITQTRPWPEGLTICGE